MRSIIRRSLLVVAAIAIATFSVSAQTKKAVLGVLNKAESTLTIFDAETLKVLGKAATGDSPHEVVLSPDGKTAFVSNYGAQIPGSSLSLIDVGTAKEIRRVDVSPLMRPHGLQLIDGKLYFTAETNRMIARYDPSANKIDWMMGTGQNGSHMVAGTADGKKFVTANIGSDSITYFEFTQSVPPGPSRIIHIPVGKQPEAVDISPNGKEAWAGLNAEGMVEIVDLVAGRSVAKLNVGGRPYRVRFTPDGKFVVCTMIPTKEVLVIDAATRKEVGRIKLEGVPLGVAFTADGKSAFITVVDPDTVVRVDLINLKVLASAPTGKSPDGVAVSGL